MDHVPSDVKLKRGCMDIPERMFNVFVFLHGEHIAMKDDGTPFAFNKHTFIYGSDLDMYPAEQFDMQKKMKQTVIEKIGVLNEAHFNELVACLSGSKIVKNKFRRMLRS